MAVTNSKMETLILYTDHSMKDYFTKYGADLSRIVVRKVPDVREKLLTHFN